jgi:hypothetical protein
LQELADSYDRSISTMRRNTAAPGRARTKENKMGDAMTTKLPAAAVVLFLLVLTAPAFAREQPTDADIRQQIIQESIADYKATGHPCACRLELRQAKRVQQTGRRFSALLRFRHHRPNGCRLETAAQPMIRTLAVAVLVTIIPAAAFSADRDEQLQARYGLCIDKADHDNLEEFRSDCDVLCMHQQHRSEQDCLAQHNNWNTGNCVLPTVQLNRQDHHLESAKDRCLQEFKAGITTPP